jgi:hypothetical protein
MMMHACNPSYSRGRGRINGVPDWPGQESLPEKQTKSKKTQGMGQAVEYLLGQHKALSSILSTAKINK